MRKCDKKPNSIELKTKFHTEIGISRKTFTFNEELVLSAVSDTPWIVLGKTAAKNSFRCQMKPFIEGPMICLGISKRIQFSVYIAAVYYQFEWMILKAMPQVRSRRIM